jgi:NAD-dependent SIR2 family protein deacetylase
LQQSPAQLVQLLQQHQPISVLTGAGCSTASGIPDYRDKSGAWKHQQPMQYQDFVGSANARRRYWRRSMAGWPRFQQAKANPCHKHLRRLEDGLPINCLITQNVDGLHDSAGQKNVIDLHGRLDQVVCLDCGDIIARANLQQKLEHLNPDFALCLKDSEFVRKIRDAPDGDAHIDDTDDLFKIVDCQLCGGRLKPNVVFFGEAVPRARVDAAFREVNKAGMLLVVGSSLMVFSGFRFARHASQQAMPLAIINRGRTRADDIATLKFDTECAELLDQLANTFCD